MIIVSMFFLGLLVCTNVPALAGNGSFPLFVEVDGVKGFVYDLEEIGSTTWLSSSEGVYYAYKNQYKALPLPPKDKKVDRRILCIASDGEDIFLGASDGLFRVAGADYERSPIAPFDVLSRFFDLRIESMVHNTKSGMLWIASSHGLFSLEKGESRAEFVSLPGLNLERDRIRSGIEVVSAESFDEAGGEEFVYELSNLLENAAVVKLVELDVDDLIVATNSQIFRIAAGVATQFSFARPGLLDVEALSTRNGVYILAFHPRALAGTLYRLSDELEVLVSSGVLDVSIMSNEVWVAKSETQAGTNIYTVDNTGGLRPISIHLEGAPSLIEIISETSKFQVLLSSQAILMRGKLDDTFSLSARKRAKRSRIDDPAFEFVDLLESDSGLWLFGSAGAYRSVDGAVIETRLRARETFFLQRSKVAIDEIFYDRSGADPFPEWFRREFWALLHFERNKFNKSRLWPSGFSSASNASVIPTGDAAVLVAVADSFGNLSFSEKEAPSPTTNYITKAVSGVLKVVFAGALTVFFTTLLAAMATKLLLWNVASKAGDPYRRLNAYVSLERWMARFSIYRVFLQPKWNEMRAVLRQIYVQINCPVPPPVNASAQRALRALSDAENSYHEEIQGPEPLDLFEVQRAIAHSGADFFEDKLPVVVRLKNFVGELNSEKVRGAVVDSLKSALPGTDDRFCGEILVRMAFVFLFSAPSRPPEVTRSIEAFFDAANRDQNLVLVIKVPIPGVARDNLTEIHGVGPMIAEVLNQAGIYSFDDVAKSSVDDLRSILRGAGARYRSHDPVTWPQQAHLAASRRTDGYADGDEIGVDKD